MTRPTVVEITIHDGAGNIMRQTFNSVYKFAYQPSDWGRNQGSVPPAVTYIDGCLACVPPYTATLRQLNLEPGHPDTVVKQ